MPKMKILLNLGHGYPDWKQDEVHEVNDEALARRLLREGVAEVVPPEAQAEVPAEAPTSNAPSVAALSDEKKPKR